MQRQPLEDETQARQARLNEISKKIGECLLKGHTMLNESCNLCDTVLMRERTGRKYCVACELENQGRPLAVPETLSGRNEEATNGMYTGAVPETGEGHVAKTVLVDQDSYMAVDGAEGYRDIKRPRMDGLGPPRLLNGDESSVQLSNKTLVGACSHLQAQLARKLYRVSAELETATDHCRVEQLLELVRSTIATVAALRALI